ncbi:type I DNA topoisomerase [Thermithiobacillus plumbiphilus]|uniref:DNA topoisomerase 1 n=1 Tax=Thermithiobacillus plumbiphilus TaxID=1729899 RepID=A0ABU9D945_9PROT
MGNRLVVVESPAKAKTINKYLGPDYTVLASYGHVRDLVPKEGAVDPEHEFAMRYDLIEKNKRHVDEIVKALKQADTLILATDPDREGEAISWHLAELLKEKGVLKNKPVERVVFHEITKNAITQAIQQPRGISYELVNAQQARRALDYLVGFNLSPLLWRKIRPGLSAGRVQSAALRLIVEREQEIEAFQTQEYWTIEASLRQDGQAFDARLVQWAGKKLEQFDLTQAEQAEAVRARIETDCQRSPLRVLKVEKKQRSRQPAAPFTTSTLQQEAARKLGFSASRTMRIAQQLYEGVSLPGEGSVGLISYMRTDAVNLAAEAISEIRGLVQERFGPDYLPASPRLYKTKSKNAQEAHEAIRPTSIQRLPEVLKGSLSAEQAKLYELIWKRTVACQMSPAKIDTVAVDLGNGGDWLLRANGSSIAFPGFISVYQEGVDDGAEEGGKLLPPLTAGDQPELLDLSASQHFTEPPPRYSEATLVKALEAYGIGRPSTYASIIQTLQNREYVELLQKRFHPTDVGRVVNKFLVEHFEQYVNYHFTAQMEDELDAVSRGEKDWKPLLHAFWTPFHERVEDKAKSVSRADVTSEQIDEACPKCGKPLALKLGKRGRFISCTGYPDCDYARPLGTDAQAEPELVGRDCPDCGQPLVFKVGRYGKFISCSGYPTCKHIEPLEKPQSTGVSCPSCNTGELVAKKSRYGKVFYSCNTYPKCTYAVWDPPLAEPCPKCGSPILTLKTTKRWGEEKLCPDRACGFRVPVGASPEIIAAAIAKPAPVLPERPEKAPAKTAKGKKTPASKAQSAKPAKAPKAAAKTEAEAKPTRARKAAAAKPDSTKAASPRKPRAAKTGT